MIPAFLGCNIEGALHPERRERVHGAWSRFRRRSSTSAIRPKPSSPDTMPQGTPRSRRNGAYPLRSHRHVDDVRRLARGSSTHMAGARKFGVEHIDRTDICAANRETAQETGIPFITEQDDELARRIVLG